MNVVLVGCGGLRVKPKCAFDVEMEVYGCKMSVPILVVPGQHDDLILGTNVIKHVLHQSRLCESYWKTASDPCPSEDPETEHFLSMPSCLNPWKGEDVPDKVSTKRCDLATCLEPGREYLIWGKLPENTTVSSGSTVMTESTSSSSAPRGILVAKIVTTLWGDRWVPPKLINTSEKPVVLRGNAKLADVYPVVAVENMDGAEHSEVPFASYTQSAVPHTADANIANDKLYPVLSEMEEKEIIRKSASEYTSPLILVWICIFTDFRCLNKRTLKDAHPLPDCLEALGGKLPVQHYKFDLRVLQCATP